MWSLSGARGELGNRAAAAFSGLPLRMWVRQMEYRSFSVVVLVLCCVSLGMRGIRDRASMLSG